MRSSRPIVVAALSLAGAACHAGDALVLTPPPVCGASALILVVHTSNGESAVQVVALASDPDWRTLTKLARADSYQIVAFVYGCSADMLGLSEGSYSTTRGAGGRPFPAGGRRLISAVELGKQSSWTEVQMDPDWLVGLRIDQKEPDPCISLVPDRFDVPMSVGEPRFLLPLTSTVALLGDTAGNVFTVGTDHMTRLLFSFPDRPLEGAFRRNDGEMWYFATPGCFFRARGLAKPELVACSPAVLDRHRAFLDGAPDGPIDLYAVSEQRVLVHFDGQSATMLRRAPASPNQKIGVAWEGPNEAVVVGLYNQTVIHAKNGTTAKEMVDLNGFDEVITVGRSRFGVVVGSNFGMLYQQQGANWLPMAHGTLDEMRVIAPLDDGLVVAGNHGEFVVVRPGPEGSSGWTVCPLEIYATDQVRKLIPLGTGLAASENNNDTTEMVFLSRAGPLKACYAELSSCP